MSSIAAEATDAPSADLLAAEAALLRTTGIEIEQRDTHVNGVRLHYLTCGEGEPLLLIHGRGSAAAFFAPVMPKLAERYRVIALDLPGWGLSDKPPFTGQSAADALAVWREGARGFLDALDIEQADVLGHSMGGFTALSLALEHPERVGRLLLVDAGGLGTRLQFDVRLYFTAPPERLYRWFGRPFARFIQRVAAGNDPNKATVEAAEFDFALMRQEAIIESGAKAFSQWVNVAGVHLTLTERLGELTQPTLLLWGDRDTITPYADALIAARYLSDGQRATFNQLVTFNRCGHSPFAERPEDFATVVLAWLDNRYVRPRI